ncbi:MAG: efflux RND transporter periplasmic adaptor subunit [Opitutales bacterium]
MKFKYLFFLIVALGLGYGAYAFFQQRAGAVDQANQLLTDTAQKRDLEFVVSATGEVLPILSSIVKSELSGRIVTLYVDEGDEVERDQLLLELDRRSFEARLDEAERSLESERLRLDRAKRDFNRQKELYAKNFVGEQAYLDAKTDYDLAQLNLEIAQSRLEDAEDELSKTKIGAPHDGIITKLDVTEGQVISGATSVSNGTDLMTVAQLRQLYLEANISEVDVERLQLGQEASLSFDAIPDFSLSGEVSSIALSARRDGNVRVFPIEAIFETTDARVRPGISARVDLPIAHSEDAVSVLLSAVFYSNEGERSFVYLKEGEGWREQPVRVGINNLQHVEILEGLQAGDVVALSRPPEFRSLDDG